MNIDEFSKKTGVSKYTLRFYEKIGLLHSIQRDNKGYRSYTQRNVICVDFLQKLKSTGMSLTDIKKYFCLLKQGDKTICARKKLLENHCSKVKEELDALQFNLTQIKCKIKTYDKLEKMIKSS